MAADEDTAHPEPTPVAAYATEGEADVAVAKLRAFGVDAVVDDQLEGGVVPIAGEDGVVVEVRAEDAADAAAILDEPGLPAADA
jgi:hypothetical protein